MSEDRPELPSDEEIRARLDRVREVIKPELEDVDPKLESILEATRAEKLSDEEHDAFHAKLAEMETRAATVKRMHESTKAKDNSLSGSLDQKSSLGMGMGLMLAYTIIGAPMVGYGIGLLINKTTGTQGWHIWTTLIGGCIGIAWTVMVTTRNADKM